MLLARNWTPMYSMSIVIAAHNIIGRFWFSNWFSLSTTTNKRPSILYVFPPKRRRTHNSNIVDMIIPVVARDFPIKTDANLGTVVSCHMIRQMHRQTYTHLYPNRHIASILLISLLLSYVTAIFNLLFLVLKILQSPHPTLIHPSYSA